MDRTIRTTRKEISVLTFSTTGSDKVCPMALYCYTTFGLTGVIFVLQQLMREPSVKAGERGVRIRES